MFRIGRGMCRQGSRAICRSIWAPRRDHCIKAAPSLRRVSNNVTMTTPKIQMKRARLPSLRGQAAGSIVHQSTAFSRTLDTCTMTRGLFPIAACVHAAPAPSTVLACIDEHHHTTGMFALAQPVCSPRSERVRKIRRQPAQQHRCRRCGGIRLNLPAAMLFDKLGYDWTTGKSLIHRSDNDLWQG
jgi:hypothetical protein